MVEVRVAGLESGFEKGCISDRCHLQVCVKLDLVARRGRIWAGRGQVLKLHLSFFLDLFVGGVGRVHTGGALDGRG